MSERKTSTGNQQMQDHVTDQMIIPQPLSTSKNENKHNRKKSIACLCERSIANDTLCGIKNKINGTFAVVLQLGLSGIWKFS